MELPYFIRKKVDQNLGKGKSENTIAKICVLVQSSYCSSLVNVHSGSQYNPSSFERRSIAMQDDAEYVNSAWQAASLLPLQMSREHIYGY
jgi:hypothetical protein